MIEVLTSLGTDVVETKESEFYFIDCNSWAKLCTWVRKLNNRAESIHYVTDVSTCNLSIHSILCAVTAVLGLTAIR